MIPWLYLTRPSTSKEPDLVPDSSINDCNENDIGKFIGQASMLSTEMKKEMLENTWSPPATYDFAEDAKHLKRKFNYSWPFCKFKDIHEHCKKHMETHFHKMALEAAKSFLGSVPVDLQLNKYYQGIIEENRKIITSIISCITFCGSHDLALRGKHYGEGILEDLYKLRNDAGDLVLKKHIEHGKKNASYRSIDIQNEIIAICGDVIKADIVKKVKEAEAYSVLADETADISGTEQLSIGLRYFDEEANEVQEMFVGFVELKAKYSALLEPVVNALQSIALDVVKALQHVKRILQLLKSHRDNLERVTDEIIKDATVVAEKVGLEEDITSMPRIVGKQRHRSNHPAESPSEF
ncbi:52 kDa repressor of the inhibitor of the protein kinase [Eumeta japonica]|uniref:52 kDa repressor of the inhibitor of the protein kinase n=1 Tax=Eumeta variegata TaxID=151549 RepID=A0A4C1T7R6_EUMVA|nr:52 kDa repressor of the inhibitor of the protein kinase [Eumeta japonica]